MQTKQLMAGGQELTVTGKPYEHMLTPNHRLVSPRLFIAKAGGLTVTQHDKREVFIEGKAEQTMKNVRELIIAKIGEEKGKALIKAANETYDAGRKAFYVDGAKIALLVAGDATLRKVTVPVFNKKGVCLGANITARYERGKNASDSAKVASLEAKVAALTQMLGAKALEAAAVA